MIRTREHLAWHVAGHAYAAMMCRFQVHMLSLDGFSEEDLSTRGNAQRLDSWTMIVPPEWPRDRFSYSRVFEGLLSVALAGPAVELAHRQLPCVVRNVEQFTDDWAQALKMAERLWANESDRRSNLERWVANSPTIVYSGWSNVFYEDVVSQLLNRGAVAGNEVQAAWERMKRAEDDYDQREQRSRRRPRSAIGKVYAPLSLDDSLIGMGLFDQP